MKLFLDDTRDPGDVYDSGEGWVVARGYDEFRILLKDWADSTDGRIFISFDHDLGSDRDGLDCAQLLSREGVVPDSYKVHSSNPVGAQRIRSFLRSWEQHAESLEDVGAQESALQNLTWYSQQIGFYENG